MIDRLQYALVGAVFGAFLAVLLWWVFGIGIGFRPQAHLAVEPSLTAWLKPLIGIGALAGFVLKDKAGSLIGAVAGAVLHVELGRDTNVPFWLFVVALAVLLVGVLFFSDQIWALLAA